uniref:Uncharacterized protein n=1 Tax=Timema douglasi TaxID=61478 RepID=A0A7R8Z488_TIMDO|nr:unnamed protein product [Timema douglasi]
MAFAGLKKQINKANQTDKRASERASDWVATLASERVISRPSSLEKMSLSKTLVAQSGRPLRIEVFRQTDKRASDWVTKLASA